ncbi:MAG TPA: hypothetical protein VG712_06875 [Gemmatimonadales bacterium]|nr:hypothetical protein [Gemmatimonadales bacterium]
MPVIEALETHAGVSSHEWTGAPTRPAEYPADLPFIPDHPFTILTVNGSTTVEWDGLSQRMVEVIARQMVHAGWVETTLPNASMPGMAIRPFRLDARQRVLIHDGRLLTLLDTRAD